MGNFFMDRILATKFLDKTMYYSKNFSEAQKNEFTGMAINRLISIFPQNLIHFFNKDFMKKDYLIATGSLVDRISYGYDKGGLLNTGSYLTELFIILDSYMLLFLFVFVCFVILFTVLDSFQKKNKSSFVFSPLIAVLFTNLVTVTHSDNLLGIISFFSRGFIQTIFLNFLIISIYLIFFTNDENISDG